VPAAVVGHAVEAPERACLLVHQRRVRSVHVFM
jgi:hypothetical protein